MKKYLALSIFAVLCITPVIAGTKSGAERIVRSYRIAELEWRQKVLTAKSEEQKSAALQQRPDSKLYGEQMIKEIGGSLRESWAMPYMVWLLDHYPALSAGKVRIMLNVVEQKQMRSPELGEFCMAVVPAGVEKKHRFASSKTSLFQQKRQFLEKVIQERKDKKVLGQASFALSRLLAALGDRPEINKERLKLIREAVIYAAEVKAGKATLGDLVLEDVYRIKNLSKGVPAPNLVGRDSRGLPMQLSRFKGKVVVLVFWSSWEQFAAVSQFLKEMEKTYVGKPVQIVGVNRDALTHLRELEKKGDTVGLNFSDPKGKLFHTYRVTASPMCFVLNKSGIIEYRGVLGSFADLTVEALLAGEKRLD